MAEVVQFQLERLLPVFSTIKQIHLFSAKEVKTIVKKIRFLEYKIQKPSKTKYDFLKYIQYVQALMDLMKKRKGRCTNKFRYKEVEFKFTILIKKLLRKVVYSNQKDVEIWYTFINFCIKMGLKEDASKIYTRMLQVHPDKPEVWIAAAKHQFEEMSMPNVARNLLQTGLQDNPNSIKLWEEYFRFELLYSDMVRKRRKILEQDLDSETYQNVTQVNFTPDKNDAVINGKIAVIVFKNAIPVFSENLNSVKTFLQILDEFEPNLRNAVKIEIVKLLEENFSSSEEIYDIKALCCMDKFYACHLKNGSEDDFESFKFEEKRIECAFAVYRSGIEAIPSVKMWNLFINFNLELLMKTNRHNQEEVLNTVLLTFDECWRSNLMSRHAFTEWIFALKIRDDFIQMDKLTIKACEKWPKFAEIWYLRLSILLDKPSFKEELKRLFSRAIRSIEYKMEDEEDEEILKDREGLVVRNVKRKTIVDVWRLFIDWSSKNYPPTGVVKMLEKNFVQLLDGRNSLTVQRKLASFIKPALLRKSMKIKQDGISYARQYYEKYKNHPPIVESFFNEMIAIETKQEKIDYKRIVNIYEDLINNFGENDHLCWLDYCKFVLANSEPTKVGLIHNRACKTLNSSEVSSFVTAYCLLQNKEL